GVAKQCSWSEGVHTRGGVQTHGQYGVQFSGPQPAVQHHAQFHRELQVDLRVAVPEAAEEVRQMGQGEVLGNAEAYTPAWLGGADHADGLVVQVEHALGVSQEGLAGSGQTHSVGVAVQQGLPDRVFQAPYVLAHCGLAQAQSPSCPGEAELSRHRDEGAYLYQVELVPHAHHDK